MELTERDYKVLGVVFRFRFCLGRQLEALAGFSGLRATDRRLRALLDAGYLARKKYLYGLPFLYTLTHKGRVLLGVNKREEKIRIDKITHDIHVLDCVIFYMEKYNVPLSAFESEKELHIKDGFGTRKHQPDFLFSFEGKKTAVEIELHLKSKERMRKNISDNYLNFDCQIWLTNDNRVSALLQSFLEEYPNIEIVRLEVVSEHVRCR